MGTADSGSSAAAAATVATAATAEKRRRRRRWRQRWRRDTQAAVVAVGAIGALAKLGARPTVLAESVARDETIATARVGTDHRRHGRPGRHGRRRRRRWARRLKVAAGRNRRNRCHNRSGLNIDAPDVPGPPSWRRRSAAGARVEADRRRWRRGRLGRRIDERWRRRRCGRRRRRRRWVGRRSGRRRAIARAAVPTIRAVEALAVLAAHLDHRPGTRRSVRAGCTC